MSNRRTRHTIRVSVDIADIEIPEAWNPIHDKHPMDFAEGLENLIQLLPDVPKDADRWSQEELLTFARSSLSIILGMVNYVKAHRNPVPASSITSSPQSSNRLPARSTSPESSQPTEESNPDLESPQPADESNPDLESPQPADESNPDLESPSTLSPAPAKPARSPSETEDSPSKPQRHAYTQHSALPAASTGIVATKAARAANKANASEASVVAASTRAVPDPNEIRTSVKHTRDNEKTVEVTTKSKRRRLAELVGRQIKAEDMDVDVEDGRQAKAGDKDIHAREEEEGHVVEGSDQSGFKSEAEHHDTEEDTDEVSTQLTSFPRPTHLRKFGYSVVGILADGLLHGKQMVLLEWEMPVGDPASVEICTSQCKSARTNTLVSALYKLEEKPLPRQQLSDMDLRGVNWCQCIRSEMNKAGHKMQGAAADSWLSSLHASTP